MVKVRRDRRAFVAHCSLLLAAACGVSAMPVRAATDAPTVLVLGDSLSAEYGIRRGSGWVELLRQRIASRKLPLDVVNASISGETTSGGRSRLPALLAEHQPRVVVIALGGNDALRGLPVSMTQANVRAMAQAAKAAGAEVLIAGIMIPPNYGRRYGEDFARLFGDVARAEDAALVPFLLAGVADVPNAERYFQADRIHPTEAAQAAILDNVWPKLEPLLKSRRG